MTLIKDPDFVHWLNDFETVRERDDKLSGVILHKDAYLYKQCNKKITMYQGILITTKSKHLKFLVMDYGLHKYTKSFLVALFPGQVYKSTVWYIEPKSYESCQAFLEAHFKTIDKLLAKTNRIFEEIYSLDPDLIK